MPKKKFKAVLFDMDGVIVDSMPYHYISWYEALLHYGIRATAFDAYSREGEDWQKTLKDLFEKEGKPLTKKIAKEVFVKRGVIFKKFFKRNIFAGAKEFIICMKNSGFKTALVTGTPIAEVKKILPKDILSKFDAVVAGDQVKRGKPFPDPYLKAAKMLGMKSKDCVVIENSPFGIKAAKAAKMYCVAVTTSLPEEYLSQADDVVDKLSEITGAFKCPITA